MNIVGWTRKIKCRWQINLMDFAASPPVVADFTPKLEQRPTQTLISPVWGILTKCKTSQGKVQNLRRWKQGKGIFCEREQASNLHEKYRPNRAKKVANSTPN